MRGRVVGILLGLAVVVAGTTKLPASAADASPTDVAGDAGIAETVRTFSANVADYDNDGHEDWFLVRHNPQVIWNGGVPSRPTLWRNRSVGGFEADTFTAFSGTDKHDCAWGDVQSDGLLDLFCAVGLDKQSVNELWMQQADHTFVERASQFGLASGTSGDYRTATFLNANGDSYPDIYVTHYTGGETTPAPNELWVNSNGASFSKAPSYGLNAAIGAQKDTNGCTQSADFNGDSFEDLMVCAAKKLYLYKNVANGGFSDVASGKRIGGFWKDAELADLNGDPRLDLVQLKPKLLRVKLQTSSGAFSKAFEYAVTGGENLAVGDFNGDSLNDVYAVGHCPDATPGTDQPDRLFVNQGAGQFTVVTLAALPTNGGCGQSVERIDYDGDASDDFVVLNGRKLKAGPVQLFTNS
jgi:FG-GAP-like repeat